MGKSGLDLLTGVNALSLAPFPTIKQGEDSTFFRKSFN